MALKAVAFGVRNLIFSFNCVYFLDNDLGLLLFPPEMKRMHFNNSGMLHLKDETIKLRF